MKKALLIVALLILVNSCVTFKRIDSAKDDNIVKIYIGGVYNYTIDLTTQLCFMETLISDGGGITDVPCCNLRKMEKAKAHLTWLSDEDCNGASK